MQLDFNLPAIDREETRKAVESILEKYRMYMLQISLDKLPSITAKYTLVSGHSNLVSSSTENAAVANVDYEISRVKFMDWVNKAVNRLSLQERKLIIRRYLGEEDDFDYTVYTELNMSHRHYYRVKSRAFYKLAFALKIEVYEQKEEVKEA